MIETFHCFDITSQVVVSSEIGTASAEMIALGCPPRLYHIYQLIDDLQAFLNWRLLSNNPRLPLALSNVG